MPQRRFNYTERKVITRDQQFMASKHPHPEGGTQLDFHIDLDDDIVQNCAGSELCMDLIVAGGAAYRRIPLGLIDNGPWQDSLRLDEIEPDDSLSLTIKAIDQHSRLILAASKPVAPESADPSQPPGTSQARSLIGLKKARLEGVVYKVEFSEVEGPLVYLNEALDDASSTGIIAFALTSPLFTSLVWPAVLREVLTYYLDNGDPPSVIDEPDSPSTKWHALARRLTGENGPDFDDQTDREDIRGWIDDAVAAFASTPKIAALDTFANAVRGG